MSKLKQLRKEAQVALPTSGETYVAEDGTVSMVMDDNFDPAYEASEQEVLEYAEWLGMKLPEDEELLWLAREGLKAPLPKEWKPCKTDTGEVYYFNFKTGDSIWDHPMDDYFKQKFETEKERLRKRKEAERQGKLPTDMPDPFSKLARNNIIFDEQGVRDSKALAAESASPRSGSLTPSTSSSAAQGKKASPSSAATAAPTAATAVESSRDGAGAKSTTSADSASSPSSVAAAAAGSSGVGKKSGAGAGSGKPGLAELKKSGEEDRLVSPRSDRTRPIQQERGAASSASSVTFSTAKVATSSGGGGSGASDLPTSSGRSSTATPAAAAAAAVTTPTSSTMSLGLGFGSRLMSEAERQLQERVRAEVEAQHRAAVEELERDFARRRGREQELHEEELADIARQLGSKKRRAVADVDDTAQEELDQAQHAAEARHRSEIAQLEAEADRHRALLNEIQATAQRRLESVSATIASGNDAAVAQQVAQIKEEIEGIRRRHAVAQQDRLDRERRRLEDERADAAAAAREAAKRDADERAARMEREHEAAMARMREEGQRAMEDEEERARRAAAGQTAAMTAELRTRTASEVDAIKREGAAKCAELRREEAERMAMMRSQHEQELAAARTRGHGGVSGVDPAMRAEIDASTDAELERLARLHTARVEARMAELRHERERHLGALRQDAVGAESGAGAAAASLSPAHLRTELEAAHAAATSALQRELDAQEDAARREAAEWRERQISRIKAELEADRRAALDEHIAARRAARAKAAAASADASAATKAAAGAAAEEATAAAVATMRAELQERHDRALRDLRAEFEEHRTKAMLRLADELAEYEQRQRRERDTSLLGAAQSGGVAERSAAEPDASEDAQRQVAAQVAAESDRLRADFKLREQDLREELRRVERDFEQQRSAIAAAHDRARKAAMERLAATAAAAQLPPSLPPHAAAERHVEDAVPDTASVARPSRSSSHSAVGAATLPPSPARRGAAIPAPASDAHLTEVLLRLDAKLDQLAQRMAFIEAAPTQRRGAAEEARRQRTPERSPTKPHAVNQQKQQQKQQRRSSGGSGGGAASLATKWGLILEELNASGARHHEMADAVREYIHRDGAGDYAHA